MIGVEAVPHLCKEQACRSLADPLPAPVAKASSTPLCDLAVSNILPFQASKDESKESEVLDQPRLSITEPSSSQTTADEKQKY